jgi:hypothetical protein
MSVSARTVQVTPKSPNRYCNPLRLRSSTASSRAGGEKPILPPDIAKLIDAVRK